jgi:tetratricopeptide (TPR) repeat protein
MLPDALNPLHPLASKAIAGMIANRGKIHLSLIKSSINPADMMATHNSSTAQRQLRLNALAGPRLCAEHQSQRPRNQRDSNGSKGLSKLETAAAGPAQAGHSRSPIATRCGLSIRWFPPGWQLAMVLLTGGISLLATESVVAPSGSQVALSAYTSAREKLNRNTNDVEAGWQFARSCFDWAEYARNDSERERIAREGIAASRQAIALNPRLGAAHYYLAFNLGQLAQTKLLGALSIVKEMERELKTARDLDESFNFGGPDRTLGQLYFQAPGWPTSIGDKATARRHFQRAVELNSRFPDNRLLLMEAWLDSRERANVRREAGSFAKLLPDLRREFAGVSWEASWTDWDRRWKVIEDKVRKFK